MTHESLRRSLLIVSCLLLLAFSYLGIQGGISQLAQHPPTLGQTIQSITQVLYGIFALKSVVTAFKWKRFNTAMLIGWTVCATIAAGMASVVWGGQSILTGIATGAATLAFALGVNWMLRFGLLPVRHAARLVVMDAEGSVLLVRYDDVRPGRPPSFWATPGGNVEPGESLVQAAKRELREETGLVAELGRKLWRQSFTVDYGQGPLRQAERFFEVRFATTRPVVANQSPEAIKELRWWTRAEIGGTTEVIFPARLARLLDIHLPTRSS